MHGKLKWWLYVFTNTGLRGAPKTTLLQLTSPASDSEKVWRVNRPFGCPAQNPSIERPFPEVKGLRH